MSALLGHPIQSGFSPSLSLHMSHLGSFSVQISAYPVAQKLQIRLSTYLRVSPRVSAIVIPTSLVPLSFLQASFSLGGSSMRRKNVIVCESGLNSSMPTLLKNSQHIGRPTWDSLNGFGTSA